MTYQNVRANLQGILMGATPAFQNVASATLSVWFLADTVAAGNRIQHSVSTGVSNTLPRLEANVNAATSRGSARRLDADATTNLNDGVVATGVLRHLAVVAQYSAGTFNVYLDTVLTSAAVASWIGNTSNTPSLRAAIGCSGIASNSADGRITDVREYSRALSADEIQTIFTARGRDSNVFGGQSRWLVNEGAPGTSVVLAVDKWIQALTGNATGAPIPVYTEWLTVNRRRRRC